VKDNNSRSTPLPFQQQVTESPLGGSNQVYLESLYEDWLISVVEAVPSQ